MHTSAMNSGTFRTTETIAATNPFLTPRRTHVMPDTRNAMDMFCLSLVMLLVVLTAIQEGRPLKLETLILMRVSLVNLCMAVLCLGLWRASFSLVETLLQEFTHRTMQLAAELGLKIGLSTAVAACVLWLRHPERSRALTCARFAVLSLFLLGAFRLMHALYALRISPALRGERGVVIVGTGVRARMVAEAIKAHPRWKYRILGYVDDRPQGSNQQLLGSLAELDNVLMNRVVDEVIIALPIKSMYDQIQAAIAACERLGVESRYSMDFFSTGVAKRRSAVESSGSIVLHMVHNDNRQHLKRALDLAGALLGLVLLSPVLLLIALLVRCTSKGPVLFRQKRFGLNKRAFTMLKFRSMVVDAEQQQATLEHLNEAGGPVFKIRKDPRITPIGSFLRATSLDELPQLVNVLRGDMSLVGPRPLPTRDVNRFSEAWLMRRFSVRPGLTGLWQVSGRSDTSFASWIALDLAYIDTWSLALDLRILARTFPVVLRRQGAA